MGVRPRITTQKYATHPQNTLRNLTQGPIQVRNNGLPYAFPTPTQHQQKTPISRGNTTCEVPFRARDTLSTRLPRVGPHIGSPPMFRKVPLGNSPRALNNKTKPLSVKSSHGVRQIVASIDEGFPGPVSADGRPLVVLARPAHDSL